MTENSKFSEYCKKGCDCFNQSNYWQAHEHWEFAWKSLESGPRKTALQACIQVAAAVHLFDLGRLDASFRMIKLALDKLAGCGFWDVKIHPSPLEGFLDSEIKELDLADLDGWITRIRNSKAHYGLSELERKTRN